LLQLYQIRFRVSSAPTSKAVFEMDSDFDEAIGELKERAAKANLWFLSFLLSMADLEAQRVKEETQAARAVRAARPKFSA
jgi:hypothetical protein